MKAHVRINSGWSQRLIFLVAVGVAFAMVLGAVLFWSARKAVFPKGEESPRSVAVVPSLAEQSFAERPGGPDQQASAVATQAIPAGALTAADLRLGLVNSAQPYPQLIQLYGRGMPGDYAIVRHVKNECAYASQLAFYAKERGLLTGNTSPIPIAPVKAGAPDPEADPVVHAQRLAALQLIEARCTPVGQDMRLHEPSASDANGKLLHRWITSENTERNTLQLLDALTAQGAPVTDPGPQLAILKQHLSEFSAFTNYRQFDGLIMLASHAAQMNTDSPGNSLRELSYCVAFGTCGKKLEELDLSSFDLPPGSPQHAKALEMVPRLRALFRL